MGLPLQPKPLGHDFGKVQIHGGASRSFQAKLAISQPGDKYEQEADQVAEQVMRMPEPRLQRQVAPEEEEEELLQTKQLLQRQAEGGTDIPSEAPAIVHEVLHSPGRPLDATTRAFMEPRFGYDFSQVRIHTGSKAVESAKAVHALAYTVGQNIVFGEHLHIPQTQTGQKVLAHELTEKGTDLFF